VKFIKKAKKEWADQNYPKSLAWKSDFSRPHAGILEMAAISGRSFV